MASLHKVKQHGRYVYRVSFYDKNGERRYIRLGEMRKTLAQSIALHVQQLADLSYAGQPPDAEQTEWLKKVGDLADKLAGVGLIVKREAPEAAPTLGLAKFIDDYIASRTDLKARTRNNFKQARDFLVKRFGADRSLASITAGDADDWRVWLRAKDGGDLSDNTARRHCGRAKQFFRTALRKRLIAENPFGDMKDTGVRANRERDYFITRADADKVLAACPDNEWQLIFALARFGGLRIPSELLALRWADVDLPGGRMTIRSPKTEHHDGQGIRIVPIFPELRPYLEAAWWDEATEGAEFVITRHRDANANLRTQLERIIERAGLTPWPKTFQNLRASRATELAADYPAHVAAEWLGHSRLVAQDHYWRVTDADFAKATAQVAEPANAANTEGDSGGGAKGGPQVAQTVALQARASKNSPREKSADNPVVLHADYNPCAPVNSLSVPPA